MHHISITTIKLTKHVYTSVNIIDRCIDKKQWREMKIFLIGLLALGSVYSFGQVSKLPNKLARCIEATNFINSYFGEKVNLDSCRDVQNDYFQGDLNFVRQNAQVILNKNPNRKLRRVVRSYPKIPYLKRLSNREGKDLKVGKLVSPIHYKGACTATLVGQRAVITAYHCISDYSENKRYKFVLDNGLESDVTGFEILRRKISDIDFGSFTSHINDLVLVSLETNLGDEVGYYEMYNGDYRKILDKKLSFVGYPAIDIKIDIFTPSYERKQVKYFYSGCDIGAMFNTLLISNCVPAGGISGGPLFYKDYKSNRKVIVGVLSGTRYRGKFDSSLWMTFQALDSESKSLLMYLKN